MPMPRLPFLRAAAGAVLVGLLAAGAAQAAEPAPAVVARAKADAFMAARQRGDYAALAEMASEGKPAADRVTVQQATQTEQATLKISGKPTSSRFVKEQEQPFGARTLVYETRFSTGKLAEEQVLTELRGGKPTVTGMVSIPCNASPCVKN